MATRKPQVYGFWVRCFTSFLIALIGAVGIRYLCEKFWHPLDLTYWETVWYFYVARTTFMLLFTPMVQLVEIVHTREED